MRLYTFINMYLSSIQQGIQTAHIVHELFNKYLHNNVARPYELLYDWSENHKTIIVLNGGDAFDIDNLYHFLLKDENPYPFTSFHESEDALWGVTTGVGIVLPESIYTEVEKLRGHSILDRVMYHTHYNLNYSSWEIELIERLATYSLAR